MNKSKIIISLFIIISVTVFSFLPSLRNGFVSWDDDAFVINNKLIKELSWNKIKIIFTSPQENLCKPLVFLFFALEYHFFKLDPFFYHLINLIFHLANCLLVFWLIFLITDKMGISFITALLFSIHPLQVESVAWVFQLKNMLSGFFFLWALILYLYYRSSRIPRYYYLALISFLLSLLSKPIGIALPFVLLTIDYFKRRRFDAYAYLDKVPFLCISVGITIISLMFSGFGVNSEWKSLKSFLSLPYQISFYLSRAFFPLKLSCLYPDLIKPETLRLPSLVFSPTVLLLLAAAVLFSQRYTRKLIFGSFFFLLLLLPIFFSNAHYEAAYKVADHFAYLALIGIFYMVAEGFFWFFRQKMASFPIIRTSLILISFLIVGILSFMTYQRTKVWKDSVTLWSDALKNYPDNIVAYNNRGLAFLKKGEYKKAALDFNRTISSDINYYGRDKALAEVFYNLNLSGLYNSTGKYERAIALLEKAIKNNPNYGYKYYNNLAVSYASAGKTEQAIALLEKAIKNNNLDDKSSFYYNLGLIYKSIGNYNEARVLFEKSIESNPGFADAYYGLGKLYDSNQEIENAISYYRKAIIYNPSNENFYNDLATAYYSIGKYKKTIALSKKALEINHNFIDAYNNLGIAYCAAGKNKQAITTLKKVIQLNPKKGEAHNNIALAYYYDKKYDLAIKHCDIAIELGYKVKPRLLELLKPYRRGER